MKIQKNVIAMIVIMGILFLVEHHFGKDLEEE